MVIRDLPDLGSLQPLPGPKATDNRSEGLLPLLRETVEKVRQDNPVTFYSMRQVAASFRAPMRAVAQAFRHLQAEGLLTCVRGSRTLVAGRKRQPQRPIRGVVGLPILLPAFAGSPNWPILFTALEEELRRHDFVADFVFFQEDEDLSPEFAERLLRHELDVLFWFVPPAGAQQTIDLVRDAGVRIVLLARDDLYSPTAQYRLSPAQPAEAGGSKHWDFESIAKRIASDISDGTAWAIKHPVVLRQTAINRVAGV